MSFENADAPLHPTPPGRRRIDSIDLLRGIVMVIMMLDHTRDFVHRDAYLFDPTDLTKTNLALFFTRWITHFCAPVFVFLAGTGAYLQFTRGKSKKDLSRFLVTRGFWLIVLEFTLVRLGATFSFDYRFFGMMQVIWVIGVSMIVLAVVIHLPLRIIAGFGLAMIGLHNLLDRFHVQGWRGPESPVPTVWAKLFIILHQAYEPFPVLWFFPSPVVFVLYPLIPWIGVMAAGYAFGALYQMSAEPRRRLLLIMGSVATLMFIVVRAINLYGDPSRWSKQSTLSFTIVSFLNTTKYPPSLLYLLMTLGPALLEHPSLLRHLWPRAAFFLSLAMAYGALHRSYCAPCCGQTVALDVWFSNWSRRTAAWRRFQPSGCLRVLDCGCAAAFSVMQVVRGR